MQIGMVGLGKMGGNMTTRLLKGGHGVVVFDHNKDAITKAKSEGANGAESLEDLVCRLNTPRAVWIMVPAGDPTESLLNELGKMLSDGDTVVDGGNSNYKDTQRRAAELKEKGISLVDVGTSGGVWGLAEGYSMMIGGEASKVKQLQPVFETLAPGETRGWGHVGSNGAGHFVKMVHNGIEYGLMQAYAEGFEIMKAKEEYELDLHDIAEIWRYGSVVRSWLLDLTAEALKEDADLSDVKDWVADSGEGRWTVAEAIELDIPAPVITLSLMMRFVSRQEERYSAKLLAAMRNQFGGHAIKRESGS
ncbi:MAG: decarboxylating 6-phosphogluconate dehydrogenase [Anaerolineales bacterium]|nr:decarboxylating 6-phosphogluconate dehydrogenase [Anaerolineales bacterium]